MNNTNGWITDRLPNVAECTNEGDVWVYLEDADEYVIRNQSQIHIGDPWREIDPPPLYVKAKRYEAVWIPELSCYTVLSGLGGRIILFGLYDQEEHREAAERIAAVFEEVMP